LTALVIKTLNLFYILFFKLDKLNSDAKAID